MDIPNQPNAMRGKDLENKIQGFKNIKYKRSVEEALKALELGEDDVVIITGSLYLAGEILNIN